MAGCVRAGPTPPGAPPTSCGRRWAGCATGEPKDSSPCGPTAASTSWGGMLRSATKNYIGIGPWLPVVPGLAIAVVVFSWNVLGDSLRDVLDPRLRGSQ